MKLRLALCMLVIIPGLLGAQGVTTAAVRGTVATHDGSPIRGASVSIVNTADGRRWSLTTSSHGTYSIEDASIGGPYRIEVRAIGFGPEARDGITVSLGQRLIANFVLEPAPIQLSAVTITGAVDAHLDRGRTGPAEIVTQARIGALPNIGRDFVNLALSSPQAAISPSTRFAQTEGVTIAGQSRLLNSFLVDGGINQDLYTGRMQPGLQTWPRPLSLEAIEQVQVLAAPMDVRYGGFAGGIVNTVTKSGTNAVHGSLFYYGTGASLTGRNETGTPVGGFQISELGGSIGGPIVRDRLHYFVSGDVYRHSIADSGPLITDTIGGADISKIGIHYDTAARFQNILGQRYGLDPGSLGPHQGEAPAVDLFAKLSVELATNSHLELSQHYVHGERNTYIVRKKGSYSLSSVVQHVPATEHASRLIWSTTLRNGWSNEMISSFLAMRDACRPSGSYPGITVQVDPGGGLSAGTIGACPISEWQSDFEISDNLTVGIGDHLLTTGVHGELLDFHDAQLQGTAGLWIFANLDSLQVGHAMHYERGIAATPAGTGFHFAPRQLGAYLQDRWNPRHSLTITAGLRIDEPFLPSPPVSNAQLRDSLGADNGQVPAGAPLWSPRLAVNYDVAGVGRTFLRTGIGLFTGHPAYAWAATPYRDDGLHQLFLSCNANQVPQFAPLNQAATCVNGATPPARLSFFDADARFPQSVKTFFGVDQRLPGDVVGTIDLLLTRGRHQLYFTDANLRAPVDSSQGEANRPLYGTIDPNTGITTFTARRVPSLQQVVRASNRDGDHTTSMSFQLRKQFGDRAALSGLYAHTRAVDRFTIVNLLAKPNLEMTPLDGTMDDRRLGTSTFEIPHRVDLDAEFRLPYRIQTAIRYSGVSGTPFTYTITGDANADGIGAAAANDIVYVPRNRADMSIDGNGTASDFGLAAARDSVYREIDRYIESEPCLRRQRGRILARNSCRNPWFGTVNLRATKDFSTGAGQSLELTSDVYNVLNMLNQRWGQYRVTTLDPGVPLLYLSGYDTANRRGVYRGQLPGFHQLQDLASRWQMELGARYIF